MPGADVSDIGCASLDKAWHIVHYLLTGTADETDSPLGILLGAGRLLEEVSEETRVVTASQMRAFSEALRLVGDDELLRRFAPETIAAMTAANVYLADAPDIAGWGEYILQGLPELRTVANACADRSAGAVVSIG